jgi:hypothetical protein
LDPDVSLPLPVPDEREVSLADRYAVLAAVWDAGWKGDEKINPWADDKYCPEAVWYWRLVHADDPAFSTGGLSNQDAAIVRAWTADVEADLAGAKSAASTALPPVDKKSKRSTEKGEAEIKIIAALTRHHKYQVNSLDADVLASMLNEEPIGCSELAKRAKVSKSSASRFFASRFKGHSKYRRACRNFDLLITALKLLNQDFSPWSLYAKEPTKDRDQRAADNALDARDMG